MKPVKPAKPQPVESGGDLATQIEVLHVQKAWGMATEVLRHPLTVFKTLMFKPRVHMSLQKHFHRQELWTVVQGSPIVQVGSTVRQLHPGSVVHIDVGMLHAVWNLTHEIVTIAETQYGPDCREDDIERFTQSGPLIGEPTLESLIVEADAAEEFALAKATRLPDPPSIVQ